MIVGRRQLGFSGQWAVVVANAGGGWIWERWALARLGAIYSFFGGEFATGRLAAGGPRGEIICGGCFFWLLLFLLGKGLAVFGVLK
jgi:hypothetical protein